MRKSALIGSFLVAIFSFVLCAKTVYAQVICDPLIEICEPCSPELGDCGGPGPGDPGDPGVDPSPSPTPDPVIDPVVAILLQIAENCQPGDVKLGLLFRAGFALQFKVLQGVITRQDQNDIIQLLVQCLPPRNARGRRR